jgi:hypothetical protein
MFAPTNVVTALPAAELLAGYARVLETLYDPGAYFERCREHLRHFEPPGGPHVPTPGALGVVARSLFAQGARGTYRREYWRFLSWVLRHQPRKLALAIAQACAGHHFVTYTREAALPALCAALAGATPCRPAVSRAGRSLRGHTHPCGSGGDTPRPAQRATIGDT